ncbi:TonB-dependent receptor [Salmonella enterica]|nr:TonB-dependent receptor [Salmonella enterica]EBI1927676.1 TonB-dependent receptor [Salmonella enterica]EHO1656922.1 TonB-dependent receptor [Salmonella enterica]EHW9861152.1 TonB-dependent receptor [Salmonella enterica subsp. enterica serovar Poona]EJG7453817.1 TonB-dependent receptor [Salmonella enterica]
MMRFSPIYLILFTATSGYSLSVHAEETMLVTGSSEYMNNSMDNVAKFADPIKDTPRSIVVIPQKLIQDTNSASLIDALKYVPGISFKSGDALARPGGDHPTLRGFDATDAVTLDGVRNTASQSRESFDIENVEVIKGPSAVYNGRGNAGGSINIVTKKPFIGNSFTKTSLGLGSDNYRRATIDTNQELSDNISARVNLMWHENDKPKRNLVDYSRWGVAPSLLISFNDATSLLLSYYHLYSNDMPDYSTPFNKKTGELLETPRGLFYGQKNRDYISNRVDTPEIVFNHDFANGASIKNTTLYSKTTQQFIATSPTFSKTKGESDLLFLQGKSGDFRTKTFSNLTDLSNQFTLGSMLHKISTGFEYTHEENKRRSILLTVDDPVTGKSWNIRSQNKSFTCAGQGLPTFTCTPIGIWNPHSPWVGHKSWEQEKAYPATHTTNNTVSGYLFDSVDVTDNIILSAGGRYDHYNTHIEILGNPKSDINTKNGLFNYQLGIVWLPLEPISLYSSWSTSSNPANSDAIQGGISDKNKENFKPEKFTSFEVGVKWTPLQERLMLGVSWFDTKQKNGHFAVDPDESRPIGEQEVKGVEFNIEGNITDNWSVFGGYSLLDTKITQSSKPSEIGNKMPLAPEQSASLWTNYNLTNQLSLGAGAAYTGKTYTNTSNSASVPGYTTVNAMAKYHINKQTKLQVNINNIFDKKYYDTLYPSFANFGPGRQIIANVEYEF